MSKLLGYYVDTHAEGAIPNGKRIRKSVFENGDGNPIGSLGTIIGSIGPLDVPGARYGYFVEWDRFPGYAVFVADRKIEQV